MSLAIGSRLGHYDVSALIGEGAWDSSIRPLIQTILIA
jgi:hypothetical protein